MCAWSSRASGRIRSRHAGAPRPGGRNSLPSWSMFWRGLTEARPHSSSMEVPLNWSLWIRQVHRWLSIIFTAVVVGIFVMLGAGKEPAEWVSFVPMFPLALLMLHGLYMFMLPYASRWHGGRRTSAPECER